MPTRSRGLVARAALAAVIAVSFMSASTALADSAGSPSADGVTPDLIAGNPNCATLNADSAYPGITSDYGFKLNGAPGNGTYTFTNPPGELTSGAPSDPNNSVTITNSDGAKFFDWAATLGIDAVIVKGGSNADAFVYAPEDLSDGDLHAPVADNGAYRDISHVEFCYDYNLEVSKTAETSYTRDYDWKVAKTNDATGTIDVTPGQSYTVNYEVTAETNGFADSDWAVSGDITVENPHPTLSAQGVSVVDELFDAADVKIATGAVDCPKAVLAPNESMTCSYETTLTGPTDGVNKATATTTTPGIGEGSGTAPFTFGDPTTVVDDCVQVSDSRKGALGEVCLADSPKTFSYSETFEFTSEQCGENVISNTATVDQSTGTDPTADSDVTFNVRCESGGGCSLTQGYWKTHSEFGPAPYDDTWALLPNGASTTFFLSGRSYIQVLRTPPAGNPYYVLAHQYIAAVLNKLNGANTTSIDSVLASAQAFFTATSPGQTLTKAKKTQILSWAAAVDAYNNGVTGPGHCDEDRSSA